MWYVGQKVVCIVGGKWNPNRNVKGEIFPIENTIYTIREIHQNLDKLYFTLIEIVNPLLPYKNKAPTELIFNEHRFRPLVEKKTNISIFTEMLNKPPTELKKSLKELEEVP